MAMFHPRHPWNLTQANAQGHCQEDPQGQVLLQTQPGATEPPMKPLKPNKKNPSLTGLGQDCVKKWPKKSSLFVFCIRKSSRYGDNIIDSLTHTNLLDVATAVGFK